MEPWIKDLKYILMPARHPVKGYEAQYSAAYAVWRAAWEKFRQEMNVTEPLNSDSFIINDEIGVIFYKDECVGLAAFTHGRLDAGTMPDHSWFKVWTKEAFEKLKDISPSCLICSQFTVSPKFAGKGHVVRWKEILFLFNHMRFERSTCGVMAGHLNLTRGMQNAGGEEYGGTILDPCLHFKYSGQMIPSQLVAYERTNIHAMMMRKGILSMCTDLWSRTINLSDFPVIDNIVPLKKIA